MTEWAQIEADLEESPVEALSEADDLVARMMEARGFPLAEREGEELAEPETVREFEEAHRVRLQIDFGESFDPGDVAVAVEAYRSLYDYLLNYGATPGIP
jgi:hypothetical protein